MTDYQMDAMIQNFYDQLQVLDEKQNLIDELLIEIEELVEQRTCRSPY